MQTVKVAKMKLIRILEKNMDKHKKEYAESYKIWQEKQVEELGKFLQNLNREYTKQSQMTHQDIIDLIEKESTKPEHDRLGYPYDYYFDWVKDNQPQKLDKPLEYTDSYQLALDMLSMSTDDDILLTQEEFKQYINDDWSWKEMFQMSNSKYSSDR